MGTQDNAREGVAVEIFECVSQFCVIGLLIFSLALPEVQGSLSTRWLNGVHVVR